MDNQKIIEKIQKLKRLAEGGSTEGEMQAAMDRMAALMEEYNISLIDLASSDDKNKAGSDPVDRDCITFYSRGRWERRIFAAVAKTYGCFYYNSGAGGHLVGSEINRLAVKDMGLYLLQTITRIATRDCRGKGRAYHAAFREGMTENIINRLRQKYQETREAIKPPEASSTPGHALALQSLYKTQRMAIDLYLKNSGVKLSHRTTKINTGNGYAHGQHEGSKVGLDRNKGIAGAGGRLLG
jgi:hypothetical protein